MSVVFTGTNQGRFTSTGQAVTLQLPTGLDYIWVYNETKLYAAGAGDGAEFYWQRGMTQGRGVLYTKEATIGALVPSQIAAGAGFYLVDTSVNIPGASTAITSITGNGGGFTSPLVLTANTNGLPVTAVVGANNPAGMVRIFNTVGAIQLGGLDFTVANVVANTSFDLIYMKAIANAAGPGTYRVIPYNPLFYPPTRLITKISQAQQAIVTLSVSHNFTVGQNVRFVIPTVTSTTFGMTQLNGLSGNIVAVNQADADGATNTITVDIDTSGFSAFAFPTTAAPGFTPAQVVPIGESTATALNAIPQANILGDATVNTGYFGILLEAGTASPAGSTGDVIYWVAGKSFNV